MSVDVLFTPNSPTTNRLVRGTRYRGDNEMGTYECIDRDPIAAEWNADVTVLGLTAKAIVAGAAGRRRRLRAGGVVRHRDAHALHGVDRRGRAHDAAVTAG
jgi:hypothetical protein